jgi:hypothetical protein
MSEKGALQRSVLGNQAIKEKLGRARIGQLS